MAQDGGGGVSSAHPARAAAPRPRRDVITLSQPRPDMARKQNEYIETPLRPQLPAAKSSKSRLKEDHGTSAAADSRCSGFPGIHRPAVRPGSLLLPGVGHGPITAQPTVAVFKKEKPPEVVSDLTDQHQDSIICRQCRRCRCEACRSARHLPSKWICNDKCLCSASALVDYCTCMCCVKGLFYHWGKDYETDSEVSYADQPCSCSPHKRLLRWSCLGLLSFALPCLLCYWPLKGCVKTCETCYTRCTAHGCRCAPSKNIRTSEQTTPEKRLLDTNSDC